MFLCWPKMPHKQDIAVGPGKPRTVYRVGVAVCPNLQPFVADGKRYRVLYGALARI